MVEWVLKRGINRRATFGRLRRSSLVKKNEIRSFQVKTAVCQARETATTRRIPNDWSLGCGRVGIGTETEEAGKSLVSHAEELLVFLRGD